MEFNNLKTYTALGILGLLLLMFYFKLNKALFSLYPQFQPTLGYICLGIISISLIIMALPYKFEGKASIIVYVILPSILILIMDMTLSQLQVLNLSNALWESLNTQLKTILVSYFIIWGLTY